jgi:hypothetical protein
MIPTHKRVCMMLVYPKCRQRGNGKRRALAFPSLFGYLTSLMPAKKKANAKPLIGAALVKEVCRRIRVARSYWDAHNNRACLVQGVGVGRARDIFQNASPLRSA